MLRFSRLLLVAASFAITACGDYALRPSELGPGDSLQVTVGDADALFVADSNAFRFTRSGGSTMGTIRLTFTNRTFKAVNFVNCHGGTHLTLQRLNRGQWERVWSPILLACLSAPIVVAPGASRAFTIGVFGADKGSNTYPQFEVPLAIGVYRVVFHDVVYDYQDRLPWGTVLPLAHRVSNQFMIVPPGGF